MTPKQEKLIENYIRTKVRGMLKEDIEQVNRSIMNYIDSRFKKLNGEQQKYLTSNLIEWLKRRKLPGE